MATEQSPLLASEAAAEAEHNLIYSRFLPHRKRAIVALVAWACFIPCMSFHWPFKCTHGVWADTIFIARDSKFSLLAHSSRPFPRWRKS